MRSAHSQSGLSVIEVLVATTIVSVIGLAAMQVVETLNLGVNGAKFRSDSNVFTEEVRGLLASPEACLNTFRTFSAAPSGSHTVNNIMDSSPAPGLPVYSTGSEYGDLNSKVVISSMLFSHKGEGATPLTYPWATSQWILRMNLQITERKASGPQVVPREILINVMYTRATGTILSCVATAKLFDAFGKEPQATSTISFLHLR